MSTTSLENVQIENICKQRKITRLCHITPFCNFKLICKTTDGICSKRKLISLGIKYTETDEERRDGELEAICCTIEYPNFYYISKLFDSRNLESIVLYIRPTLI